MKSSVSGFPELSIIERDFEQKIIQTIQKCFILNGFNNIDCRLVEPLNSLLSKGETSKEVYLLTRLQNPEVDLNSSKQLGLRFDLTVPFARYISENLNDIPSTFFRSSIGPVFRGERPQSGRFRQFTQADVDIVAKQENGKTADETLPIFHDLKIVLTIQNALYSIKQYGLPDFKININNRKFLQNVYNEIGIKNFADALNIIDKIAKLDTDEIKKQLIELGETKESVELCLKISQIKAETSSELVDKLSKHIDNVETIDGFNELVYILKRTDGNVIANLSIARGLDYYTGSVFETFFDEFPEFGSISSGGRYENLVSSINSKLKVPGVGMSIGVTRILTILLDEQKNKVFNEFKNNYAYTPIVVLVNSEETRNISDEIAKLIRNESIPCLVSVNSNKYGKQIENAEKIGATYVIFPPENANNGFKLENCEIKNIKSGVQKPFNFEELNEYMI